MLYYTKDNQKFITKIEGQPTSNGLQRFSQVIFVNHKPTIEDARILFQYSEPVAYNTGIENWKVIKIK